MSGGDEHIARKSDTESQVKIKKQQQFRYRSQLGQTLQTAEFFRIPRLSDFDRRHLTNQ